MAYSGETLTIAGTAMSGKVKEYKVQYAKLWKDAERNMNGNISASLIGVFTKISVTFRAGLSQDDIKTLSGLLNTPYFSVTYFDPATENSKSESFYASDFDIKYLSKSLDLFDEFSVNLIATAKRT